MAFSANARATPPPREARLEVHRDGAWVEVAKAPVIYPGWDAHFRIEKWDATRDVPYRVRHGTEAMFEGLIRRADAARYGLNIADVQEIVAGGVGGMNIGETVEGLQRFPINLRYPRELRDSLPELRALPIVAPGGQRLVLSDVADLRITGSFPLHDSDKALAALALSLPVRSEQLGPWWTRVVPAEK